VAPMATQSILIVEDSREIAELLQYNLAKEGYRVTTTPSGEEGLRLAAARRPDLVILDLMLPDIDGLEVCRRLKRARQTASLPVVMLTAKGEEADVVTGLEMGADDYIAKPFSPRVLLARIRAVLRRREVEAAPPDSVIRVHNLQIDPGRFELRVDGEPVVLTATEFRVLHALARRPGWVFTRRQIAAAVHGEDDVVTDRAVDVQIVGLRRKLGSAAKYVETIRGVGYRFKD